MAVAAGCLGLIALTTGATASYRSVGPYGRIGTQYVAKQICSCVFVVGRSEGSCRKEFEPDIEKFEVRVSRDNGQGEVRTRLAVFEGHAAFDPRYGCTIPD